MKRAKGVLLLKDYDEVEESNLELDYLLSLSIAERFRLMQTKNSEMIRLLEQHGHRMPSEIIKRK